jgi:hypothetical protein
MKGICCSCQQVHPLELNMVGHWVLAEHDGVMGQHCCPGSGSLPLRVVREPQARPIFPVAPSPFTFDVDLASMFFGELRIRS